MKSNQKDILLQTAKAAVISAVERRNVARPTTDDPELLEERGCFVTLKNGQELRGCIGQFTADRTLVEMVWQMAIASAMHDPRFTANRITPRELPELDIELSVLSPMEPTDAPLSLELGKHGIYVTDGLRGGCFLPQVATETGWSQEEFLEYCCIHKAGLRSGAWRNDPKVTVYLFTADVFGSAWNEIEEPME